MHTHTPTLVVNRLDDCFAGLKQAGRAALVTYIMAGDPDPALSLEVMAGLPAAGADIIELGMPFSDPMADGPTIQAAAGRALKAGMTLPGTLELLRQFRRQDRKTPVVLMGYYNPVYSYGSARFAADAAEAGADGVILVDLPPEEAESFVVDLAHNGLHMICLAAPTTDSRRLSVILDRAGGFLYYVSVTGVTGTVLADVEEVRSSVDRLRRTTDLPVATGFGIRTPDQAAAFARFADAVVVGSALVEVIADKSKGSGQVPAALGFVASLAEGVRLAGK